MSKKHPGVYLRGQVVLDQIFPQRPAIPREQPFLKESDAVRLLNLRRSDIARGIQVAPKIGGVFISAGLYRWRGETVQRHQDRLEERHPEGRTSWQDLTRFQTNSSEEFSSRGYSGEGRHA